MEPSFLLQVDLKTDILCHLAAEVNVCLKVTEYYIVRCSCTFSNEVEYMFIDPV